MVMHQGAKKKGRSDLNETDGLFRVWQKSSFSGSILPFISLICVARFSGEPSLSRFACYPRRAAAAFSQQPWFRISLRTNFSLPKRESKDDANGTKTIIQCCFSGSHRTAQMIS